MFRKMNSTPQKLSLLERTFVPELIVQIYTYQTAHFIVVFFLNVDIFCCFLLLFVLCVFHSMLRSSRFVIPKHISGLLQNKYDSTAFVLDSIALQ